MARVIVALALLAGQAAASYDVIANCAAPRPLGPNFGVVVVDLRARATRDVAISAPGTDDARGRSPPDPSQTVRRRTSCPTR